MGSSSINGTAKIIDASLIILVLALFGYVFANTLRAIAITCWSDEDYSHGLILPLVSLYVLWLRKDEIRAAFQGDGLTRKGNYVFGLPSLVLGLVLVSLGEVTSILFVSWFALFPVAIGILLLIFGWNRAQLFIPPVLLLFMAKPLPDSLVPKLFFPLQVLAAKVSAAVLKVLGVPVYLVGNIIEIPHMRLMVEEACSGIRSMLALLSVAFIVMLLVPMKWWARVAVLFISVVTAIALNVVRVAVTGILAHFYDPKWATGFFHTFSGMIVFIVGLIIVYGIAALFAPRSTAAINDTK